MQALNCFINDFSLINQEKFINMNNCQILDTHNIYMQQLVGSKKDFCKKIKQLSNFFSKFVNQIKMIMKLEKYISDLLYRYDLVVIPGFGSIIGRKKNARFDTKSSLFLPPYKELSFNVNLKENDGLLVRYVADLHQISNEEALSQIQQEVANWNQILKLTGSLKLEQIGVFKLLDESRIVYLPLTTKNYLAEAYGLSSVIRKPLIATQAKEISLADKAFEKNNKTRFKKEHKPVKHPVVYRKKSKITWNTVKYAAIFVVGMGLFGSIAKLYQNQSTMPVEKFQKATFILKQDFPVITIEKPQIKKENKVVSVEETNPNIFIISGAFRNKRNAEKKVAELQKNGYNAQIIRQHKHKLFMVAYQGYVLEEEARKDLINIKKTQASAWIYKK
jgi:nucleoid DNA-binding protein